MVAPARCGEAIRLAWRGWRYLAASRLTTPFLLPFITTEAGWKVSINDFGILRCDSAASYDDQFNWTSVAWPSGGPRGHGYHRPFAKLAAICFSPNWWTGESSMQRSEMDAWRSSKSWAGEIFNSMQFDWDFALFSPESPPISSSYNENVPTRLTPAKSPGSDPGVLNNGIPVFDLQFLLLHNSALRSPVCASLLLTSHIKSSSLL